MKRIAHGRTAAGTSHPARSSSKECYAHERDDDVARGDEQDAPAGQVTRRVLLRRAAVTATGVAAAGLVAADPASAAYPDASHYSADVPAAWFELSLDLVRTTPGQGAPIAARAFGYAGVALHESIAPGTPRRRSLAPRLNGLRATPTGGGAHHWPTVANSALASMMRKLFAAAPAAGAQAIDDLERGFADGARATLPLAVYRRSVQRGEDVARRVFEWSAGDGSDAMHPPWVPPVGPDKWVPTPPDFAPAVLPYWGTVRPLALPSGASYPPPPPPPYSEAPGTAFYDEAFECYSVGRSLTAEQEAIARFWADAPGVTATPAGHTVSILNRLVRARDMRLDRGAEAYAKVGIAVADAFIACWHTKYQYNLVRPVTYIRRVIDATWTPLLVTPSFPEYTSGHSVQSGAAAEVLTRLFGRVAFVDHTHDRLGLPARSFDSFAAAAQEAAISRLYGGIHYRSAIDVGLRQGRAVGQRASAVLG
jgi:hypothetical protein